jgi:addiction module HigA family antidote
MTDGEKIGNIHPGEVLLEDWLKPLGMSAYRLAQGTGMSRTAVGQILAGKRAITAETALRLSRFLGCSPQFWLGLQADYDLEEAEEALAEALAGIVNYKDQPPPDPRRLRPSLRRTRPPSGGCPAAEPRETQVAA